jgi:hypothetical protein
MKHLRAEFILLFAIFSVASSLSAQGLTLKGIKGGINLTTFSGADKNLQGIEPSIDIKVAVGIFANIEIIKKLSIRPEVYYSSKGPKYEQLKMTLNYIDIPLLIVYNPVKQFGIFAGPQMSIYLNGEAEVDQNALEIEKDQVNSPEYALVFGINYFVNNFHFDVRYALGLKDVFIEEDQSSDIKNSVIQILFGIAL